MRFTHGLGKGALIIIIIFMNVCNAPPQKKKNWAAIFVYVYLLFIDCSFAGVGEKHFPNYRYRHLSQERKSLNLGRIIRYINYLALLSRSIQSLKTKDRGLNFFKVYFHRVTVIGNRYEGTGISALLKEQSWETLEMWIVGYSFF